MLGETLQTQLYQAYCALEQQLCLRLTNNIHTRDLHCQLTTLLVILDHLLYFPLHG